MPFYLITIVKLINKVKNIYKVTMELNNNIQPIEKKSSIRSGIKNFSGKSYLSNIFVVGLLAFVAGMIFGLLNEKNMFDEDGFGAISKHFAENSDFNGSLRRGPLFPLVYGFFIKLFGYYNFGFVILQSLFLAFIGIISYVISLKLIKKNNVAIITSLVVVLNPMCLMYVPRFLVELLFSSLVLLQIWFAYRSVVQPKYKNYILFGIISGVSVLCKSVTLLFPLFIAFTVLLFRLLHIELFKKVDNRSIAKLFVLPTLIMLLTILPWTIRNYNVSGRFVLVSKGAGYEYLRGKYIAQENAYIDLKKTNAEIWTKFFVEFDQILKNDYKSELELQDKLDLMMKEDIQKNPVGYIKRTLKQIPTFWMRGENLMKSLAYMGMSMALIFFFFVGFFKLRKSSVFVYIVLCAAVYFNLIYASILAIARYSVPLYPPMLIVGSMGLIYIYQRLFVKTEN
jgi:hypothetical protein